MKTPRGFSLAELMVALLVAGIIGIALTRLVINQSRFVASQDGMMRARSGARAALNVMTYELRNVSTGGVTAANRDSIDVRIPYAFGTVCGYTAGQTVVTLVPPDSSVWAGASATTSGYAYYNSGTNTWTFRDGETRSAGSTATCYSASPFNITVLPPPSGGPIGVYVTGATAPVGSTLFLYQKIRYAFAASTQMPGRRALWRTTLANNVREEVVVPFDTTAKFEFLVGPMFAARTSAPAILDSIAGLRVRLNAQSENSPAGRTAPLLFRMTSDVIFRNHEF